MYWDVIEVKPEGDLGLWVKFTDHTSGHVKFSLQFMTGVFSPLRDPEFFKKVYISEGAVTWPGELDLAPDAMYHEIREKGECFLKD